GVDTVVNAFDVIHQKMPDVKLVLVGGASGPLGSVELEKLHAYVEELGLGDSVRFWPAQAHSQMPTFYRAANVVLVPSRSESFGLVAAEAQASGTPVVAARVGGLAEVVADGKSGILIDGWDPLDYGGAVLEILGDEDLADRMSVAAVEHSRRFSWETTANRLSELYAGIVSG
ncbi:MAG TPA: glycosyltransferase, partial [Actinobacteria bacterium]|nr:glycosyltransferase [Actinomycetota bacterium]